MNASEKMKGFAMKQLYGWLDKNPEENIPKVLDYLEAHDADGHGVTDQVRAIRKAIADPDNNWSRLVRSLWTDIDAGQRRKLVETVVVNDSMIGTPRTEKMQEKHHCNVPWAILMDPTSACNLHCTGCWAAEYGNRLNLSYEQLDSVIEQAKELGTYMFIYSGGEPLMRKADLIRLCEKHQDCAFLAFTNGTLIDDAFADEMLRVKNFAPAISLEGFREATDSRRGEGTYDKVIKAMKILHERKLIYGISCCYTSANYESITSEEYWDMIIENGAYFVWYFHYMPVGNDASPDLLPTPEQREFVYRRIRKNRSTKPLFAMDFQNDGEFVGGCIAGGRSYLHINANGDVEPCAFIHYADSNIREKSLLEALQSPLFMAYHDGQPFNDNMMQPCPMLENPQKLRGIVEKSGAKSTDMQSPETADHLCSKCDSYAACWEPKAQELWEARKAEKAAQSNK